MDILPLIIGTFSILIIACVSIVIVWYYYKNNLRELKNYERGLKMIPLMIHLPPSSEDIEGGGRDARDVTEEMLSQAQVMYNIISSTAQKGFKNKIYGQRHVSFEVVAKGGLIYYYAVVPFALTDVIKQAVSAAYPAARLEEVEDNAIFGDHTRSTGVIGGEFNLKKSYTYPILTYEETKRDGSRALLNALTSATKNDSIGVQFLIRPAAENWTRDSASEIERIKKNRASGKSSSSGIFQTTGMAGALWEAPTYDKKSEERQVDTELTPAEQQQIEQIQNKTRYPGHEVLVRLVVSSDTAVNSQRLMKQVVAAFSMFDSPTSNGLVFTPTSNIDELVTAYILRFFPQKINKNILNSVELATLYHLPDQKNIPTAQVKRQASRQVDGPTDVMEQGFLLGYNDFRGVRKPIRLSDNDRRRHLYMIGQTGTGKSKFLENLAFQDMMDGRGFAFIDPHGDSAEALMGAIPRERVEDVIYFNPADMENPIGLNMFEYNSPDQKDYLVQESISMLYGLYDPGHTGIIGPRLEHIFRNAALLLMSDPNGGTFVDIPKLLVDQEFMKSKLKYVTDPTVLEFWTKEWPASQRSSEAGDLVSWVVSKFGPFLSNDAMRNIIGQTKSGFNLREIMDNRKILIVNLSKGRLGELNSKLLGIVFVMKFQAAAMSRADMAEHEREDFSLYVDEFQNFMTESFETILSEARKYRLSLVLANQFMTQLTDKIREAIIGNVGTVISGRIGITDAEILVKKFEPVFTTDDLTKMPNFQGVASVMINNTPSSPFSMAFTPPMVNPNERLADAMKKLSATKYGRPRAQVEEEFKKRMSGSQPGQAAVGSGSAPKAVSSGTTSFLDEWLRKRKAANKTPSSSAVRPSPPQVKPFVGKPQPQPTKQVGVPQQANVQAPRPNSGPSMADGVGVAQAPRPNPSPQPAAVPSVQAPIQATSPPSRGPEAGSAPVQPSPQAPKTSSGQPPQNVAPKRRQSSSDEVVISLR